MAKHDIAITKYIHAIRRSLLSVQREVCLHRSFLDGREVQVRTRGHLWDSSADFDEVTSFSHYGKCHRKLATALAGVGARNENKTKVCRDHTNTMCLRHPHLGLTNTAKRRTMLAPTQRSKHTYRELFRTKQPLSVSYNGGVVDKSSKNNSNKIGTKGAYYKWRSYIPN